MAITVTKPDPYLAPAFPAAERAARLAWNVVYACLFRPSPRPFHAWRAFLLRCFGAKLGRNCHIYPKAKISNPANLHCEDVVAIADDAIIYNPSPIRIGSHAIISQEAYLCGATHDYQDPAFPFQSFPSTIGAYAWVCARATVQPGVSLGTGAILGLGSIATADLDAWSVYAGVPARRIKSRRSFYEDKQHAIANG